MYIKLVGCPASGVLLNHFKYGEVDTRVNVKYLSVGPNSVDQLQCPFPSIVTSRARGIIGVLTSVVTPGLLPPFVSAHLEPLLVFGINRCGLQSGVIVLVSALGQPTSPAAADQPSSFPFQPLAQHAQQILLSSPAAALPQSHQQPAASSVEATVKLEAGANFAQPVADSSGPHANGFASRNYSISSERAGAASSAASAAAMKRPPGFALQNARPLQRIKQEGVS